MRLLYFSPVSAGSYAQRPHFMVRACLDWGVESALWVNPYPCRLPRWQDVRRARKLNDQGTPPAPRVRVLDLWALPIEPLPGGAWLNRRLLWRKAWRAIEEYAAGDSLILGIGRPCALALAALDQLRPAASFFDAMDNFPEFYRGLSRRAMRRHEDAIAEKVDLVVASSTFLAEKFARRGLRVEKVLNGCEDEKAKGERRRAEACQAPCPPPSTLRRPPSAPVLGYVGCIGHWFDWPLVIRLAKALPQARVELVGPCAVAPPPDLPANVRLLPACEKSQAAGHLARFSAGLIPRRSSALTAGMDPVKYYEYRAAGLPVLSTSFGEMMFRDCDDGVYFLDRTDDLAGTVAAALGHGCDPAEAHRFRRQNSWTSRFHESTGLRSLWPALRMRRAA
jgi:glycosyltransferase involved in cell wall biosynthesis